jgi:hypothetical protein
VIAQQSDPSMTDSFVIYFRLFKLDVLCEKCDWCSVIIFHYIEMDEWPW